MGVDTSADFTVGCMVNSCDLSPGYSLEFSGEKSNDITIDLTVKLDLAPKSALESAPIGS